MRENTLTALFDFSILMMKTAMCIRERSTIHLAILVASAVAVVAATSGKCGAQADADDYCHLASTNKPHRSTAIEPVATELPLKLNKGDRIALIGNTLMEGREEFGQFEA